MPELRCASCEDFYVLRDGAAGLFLAASRFPRNRETRAPFIDELLVVGDRLDPKYHYLLEAPRHDPDGNRSQLRFSRKLHRQYVMTERAGKPTGWRAFHRDSKWSVSKES